MEIPSVVVLYCVYRNYIREPFEAHSNDEDDKKKKKISLQNLSNVYIKNKLKTCV